jgi:mycofactocin glycosyltransferase
MRTGTRTPRRLPAGFAVRLSVDTFCRDGGRSVTGGTSGRVVYLTSAAAAALGGTRTVVARDPVSTALAATLLDRGLADPWWADPPQDDRVDDVTVVIPVKDRVEPLTRLLRTLPAGTPVIVVDDGSTAAAATAEAARRHDALLVRQHTSLGPAAARNAGLTRASTPFVAFVDSDVVPVPGWLGGLRRHFADPGVGIVGPRVLGMPAAAGDSWLCRYEAVRSSLDLGPAPAPVQPHGRVAYLPGAALMVRRAAVSGGFDPAWHVAEDVDLVWRAQRAGWRVRYEPGAVVRHEHRTRLGPWLRRKVFYGTGAAPLAERHGTAVAPLVLSPWSTLLAVTVLAQRRWSVPAAAAVCGVVTVRVARRLRRSDRPVRTAAALTLAGAGATARQVGSALTRHYWPLALPAACGATHPRRALLVAVVAEAVADYRRTRPDLDPLRYLVARRLDDAAYGAGLWLGAVRGRSPRALLPAVRGLAGVPGGRGSRPVHRAHPHRSSRR